MDEPITTPEQEAKMKEEHEFRSYPLKKAVMTLFEDDYDSNDFMTVSEVNEYIKNWCLWAYKEGKMSKEHKNPSNKQIKRAMDDAGFSQGFKKMYDVLADDKISTRIYNDITISEKGCRLIKLIKPRKQQTLDH